MTRRSDPPEWVEPLLASLIVLGACIFIAAMLVVVILVALALTGDMALFR